MKKYLKYHYVKEIEFPLYRGVLVVMLSNDLDLVRKDIEEFKLEDIYGHTINVNWKGNNGFVVLLNLDNDYRKTHHGTIAHEAIHATNMLLDSRGVLADFNNDEAQAYLLEWVVDEIYRFISEKEMSNKIV